MSHHRTNNRRSIRLKGYDYSQPGIYFVTICFGDRQCYFGRIENQETKLSTIGEMAQKYWEEIPHHFNHVELDNYIIMPDHIQGILVLKNKNHETGVQNVKSLFLIHFFWKNPEKIFQLFDPSLLF